VTFKPAIIKQLQQIEIVDNDLPAPWLFAIVLGCRHGPR
jgi:hypothetical protein